MTIQKLGVQNFGFVSSPSSGMTGFALDDTSKALALSFMLAQDSVLSKIKVYCSAITGSPTASAWLYSEASATGYPDASIDGPHAFGGISALAWIESTGFTYTCLAGIRYFIVIKNTTGSTSMSVRYGNTGTGPYWICCPGNSYWGWSAMDSVDGSTWLHPYPNTCGMRLEFSSPAGFDGFPVYGCQQTTGPASSVARELGVRFITPANAKFKVRALGMPILKAGTPAGNLRFRLYDDTPTLLATSATTIPPGRIVAATPIWTCIYLSSTIELAASTPYRIVQSSDANQTATAYYGTYEYSIENNADSKALMPLGAKETISLDGGTSFTDYDTKIVPFVMVLDTDGEFGTIAAGGGSHPFFGDRSGGLY